MRLRVILSVSFFLEKLLENSPTTISVILFCCCLPLVGFPNISARRAVPYGRQLSVVSRSVGRFCCVFLIGGGGSCCFSLSSVVATVNL